MCSAKINYNFKVLLMALCLITAPLQSFGAESPIYIEADHMTSTENNNAVLFTGDVDAKQGNLRIRSDKMTVYYTDNKDQGGEKPASALRPCNR